MRRKTSGPRRSRAAQRTRATAPAADAQRARKVPKAASRRPPSARATAAAPELRLDLDPFPPLATSSSAATPARQPFLAPPA